MMKVKIIGDLITSQEPLVSIFWCILSQSIHSVQFFLYKIRIILHILLIYIYGYIYIRIYICNPRVINIII